MDVEFNPYYIFVRLRLAERRVIITTVFYLPTWVCHYRICRVIRTMLGFMCPSGFATTAFVELLEQLGFMCPSGFATIAFVVILTIGFYVPKLVCHNCICSCKQFAVQSLPM